MRPRPLVPTLVALALGPTLAAAQERDAPLTFALAAGASVPTGDYRRLASTGVSASGHVGVRPRGWPVGVRLDLSYDRWSFGRQAVIDANGVRHGSIEAHQGTLGAAAQLVAPLPVGGRTVRPYLLAGGGFYASRVTVSNTLSRTPGDWRLDGGVAAGAGVELGRGRVRPVVEARYHRLLQPGARDASYVPIVLGARF